MFSLALVLFTTDFFRAQTMAQIKELKEANERLLTINDSLETDNLVLGLIVENVTKEVDSLKNKSEKNAQIIKGLKSIIYDKNDRDYFVRASDSVILSIFEGTNIETDNNR